MNTHKFLYKIALCLVAAGILVGFESCKKDDIAPSKEDAVFVKYYGHVGTQQAGDVSQTADGGYIMLGSTNSYGASTYRDAMVIKTDTAGNETWSMIYGKGTVAKNTIVDVRYESYADEIGTKIIELADEAGYILMVNRIYHWDQDQDGSIVPGRAKILLYHIDIAGAVVLETELKASDDKSYWGYDIKKTSDGGFVIVGETNNVNINKPQYNSYKEFDKRDIFITRLNADFTETWASGAASSQGKGFVGLDKGVSVEISTDGYYIVVGKVQELDGSTLEDNIIVVKYEPSQGGIVNQKTFGQGVTASAASSCYDSTTNVLMVLGDFKEGELKQQLMAFELDVAGFNLDLIGSVQEYPGSGNAIAAEFGAGNISAAKKTGASLVANDVALLSSEDGYLVLATNGEANNDLESQILMFRLGSDLSVATDSEKYFGYNSTDKVYSSTDVGSQIITVSEAIEGTTQSQIGAYMFTGTFETGTNQMIGLVKVKTDGSFNPDEE
ncbi:MAG: hypothetical protein GY810_04800 [Aureispira sp.]|nr:hypothetical protein [Aureispira sp.]